MFQVAFRGETEEAEKFNAEEQDRACAVVFLNNDVKSSVTVSGAFGPKDTSPTCSRMFSWMWPNFRRRSKLDDYIAYEIGDISFVILTC
jgi:hypothetical protein